MEDHYLPMAAAIVQPAPPGETIPTPVAQSPVPLGEFFSEWRRVLSGNFWWACAAVAIPVLFEAVRRALAIARDGDGWMNLLVLPLVAFPLYYGTQGALLWRFAGSAAHGPLRRGPVLGVFWGFRFFGAVSFYDILGSLCTLSVAAPLGLIFWAGLSRRYGFASFGERPMEWIVLFIAMLPLFLLNAFIMARWVAAVPAVTAENKTFAAAITRSEALVRSRMWTTFAFVAILQLGCGVIPMLGQTWHVPWSTMLGHASAEPLWWPFAFAPFKAIAWVTGSAALVAAYSALTRASVVPERVGEHREDRPPLSSKSSAPRPIELSGYAIAAGYFGALALLPGLGPAAILFGVIALRQLRLEPGSLGRGRAIFCVAMGALSTLAYGVLIAVIVSDVFVPSFLFTSGL